MHPSIHLPGTKFGILDEMRSVCLLVVSSVLVSANSVLFDLEPNQEKVNDRFSLRNGKAMRAFCMQCFSEDIEQHELFVAGFSTKDAVDFKVRDKLRASHL